MWASRRQARPATPSRVDFEPPRGHRGFNSPGRVCEGGGGVYHYYITTLLGK